MALEDKVCKDNENFKDEVEKTESKMSKLEINSKEIAKHMMDSTKLSLQRFKKAANSKGVPDEDSYQEMCTKTKAYGGFGRRIFDKEEMFDEDDVNNDGGCAERIKNAKPKYMDALDDISTKNDQNGTKDPIQYGLWDECDPKNVTRVKGNQKVAEDIIKDIPDYERTKEKKTEMQKFINDYNNIVLNESSTSKSKLSTGKYLLSSDLEFSTTHTKFEEADILRWFKGFRKECPNGHLAKSHLSKPFRNVFPEGNGDIFTNHIFKIFDKDNYGFLDFKEF